jgi:hypothetical protein
LKITDVKAHPMLIPRPQPSWTAHEITTEATLSLVEVRTGGGVIGYGEIQGGPLPLICGLVEQFDEIIRGMDALAHLDVWQKLFALTSPRPGGIGGRDGLPPPLPRGQRRQILAAIGGLTSRRGTSKERLPICPSTGCLAVHARSSLRTLPAAIMSKGRLSPAALKNWGDMSPPATR